VIERRRPLGTIDAFEWYCPACHQRIHRAEIQLQSIVDDLPPVFETFYASIERRTCGNCGNGSPGEGRIIIRRAAAAAVFFLGILLAIAPLVASAHARFDGSTPAAGAEVRQAPALVTLRFDDDRGNIARIAARPRRRRRRSRARCALPSRRNTHDVEVRTPALAQGQYTVVWQIVADDGHVGHGRFAFGVGVPAAVLAATADAPVGPVITTVVAVLRFALLAGC